MAAVLSGLDQPFPQPRSRPRSTIAWSRRCPPNTLLPTCGIKAGTLQGQQRGHLSQDRDRDRSSRAIGLRALELGQEGAARGHRENGQEKNPAAWYYLGRIYLQQGDIVGADSAFTKAEALTPACKQDISEAALHRLGARWSTAESLRQGAEQRFGARALSPGQHDLSGQALLTLNAGVIFANTGQTDSAIAYWQKASEIAERTNTAEDRNTATRNLAAMLPAGRPPSGRDPGPGEVSRPGCLNDAEVKRALATSYRATGQNDKAAALEKEVGSRCRRPARAGGLPAAAPMNAAIALYNEKKYDEAAAAFEQVVAAEPYNRDALYGLANAYIGLKNGPKLARTAARLAAIEPLNDEVVRMLATGQRHGQEGSRWPTRRPFR